MASPVFLGLDFGTSGARACAIAENGEIEDFARLEFGRLDAHELAPAWRGALFDLLAGLPIGLRKRLAGIALDGTSATVLACDETLAALHPPLLYNDSRARAEAELIGQAAGLGNPAASATSGLAKVLWLRPRLPSGREHLFLNQADWLAGLLTGQPGISDYHNALKMGFEPGVQDWPGWVAEVIRKPMVRRVLEDGRPVEDDGMPAISNTMNLPAWRLPRVVAPGTAIGVLDRTHAVALNIPLDCLVRAGTTDSIAAFLAAGPRQPGEAVTSLGSTLVLKLISEKRVDDARLGVYSHWYGDRWLAGGASNAGGAVLRQFFSDGELAELSARIDPRSDSGLDYYPLPCPGERFPVNDPNLPPRLEPRPADRAQFLHGLLDGLAAIEARGYAVLAGLGASPLSRVVSSGGGAGNAVYAGIRQRRLAVPVATAPRQEAAYGSALLALHGSCLFPGVCNG
ncbi:MAG: FGGY-family carbohydrate kinase [Gallionellaceae bacterium]|nr:FGGY-family carbohydrate kinase [Gallionellaceae bacterium]